MNLLAT